MSTCSRADVTLLQASASSPNDVKVTAMATLPVKTTDSANTGARRGEIYVCVCVQEGESIRMSSQRDEGTKNANEDGSLEPSLLLQ